MPATGRFADGITTAPAQGGLQNSYGTQHSYHSTAASQQTHRLLYATLLLLLMLLFPKLQSDFTLFALISKAENLMIQISEIGIQPLAGTQHYIQGGLVSWKILFSLLILHVKDNTATEKQHKNYTKDS